MPRKQVPDSRPNVLVVDDEAPIRQIARRMLEAGGYEVHEASNGLEAIKVVESDRPVDLLVADLNMPELSGDEMVRRIRQIQPDLKVLYLTGFIDRLMNARPLWEGEAFLDKPFSTAELQEAVSLLCFGTIKGNDALKIH